MCSKTKLVNWLAHALKAKNMSKSALETRRSIVLVVIWRKTYVVIKIISRQIIHSAFLLTGYSVSLRVPTGFSTKIYDAIP